MCKDRYCDPTRKGGMWVVGPSGPPLGLSWKDLPRREERFEMTPDPKQATSEISTLKVGYDNAWESVQIWIAVETRALVRIMAGSKGEFCCTARDHKTFRQESLQRQCRHARLPRMFYGTVPQYIVCPSVVHS